MTSHLSMAVYAFLFSRPELRVINVVRRTQIRERDAAVPAGLEVR